MFRKISAALFITLRLVSATGIAVIEDIAAKVNGDIITRSQVERAGRHEDTLRGLIDDLLLVQRATQAGISVDADVSRHMAGLQRQSGIADPGAFQDYIREQAGKPFEDFKRDVQGFYLKQRILAQEVGSRIVIPTAEAKKHYQENRQSYMRANQVFLREILISTEGKSAAGLAEAEKKARELSSRAKRGEKFPELAREHSDSATRNRYGELGGMKHEELDPKIADIVFGAERGFVTGPIRVRQGFLVLKVEEKHNAGLPRFEEVEQQVRNELIQRKFPGKMREFLTKLRYESFLEIKPGYVDSGAAEGKNTAWTDPARLMPETVTKESVRKQSRGRR